MPQNPSPSAVIWLTGLSGAGKSTIANILARLLDEQGKRVEILDGDVIRNVFPNTGFSMQERNEHVRRVGFLASRLEHHGVTVIAGLISPYEESRRFVRDTCKRYFEVYLSTPLAVCEARDPKGLYKRARAGELKHFTGIDDPYEKPSAPDFTIDTSLVSPQQAATLIWRAVFSPQVDRHIDNFGSAPREISG